MQRSLTTDEFVSIVILIELTICQQAIIDNPLQGVPRQSFPYKHLALTGLCLTGLPRAAGTGVLKKHLEKEDTIKRWESSSWAKKMALVQKRKQLNDFGRFNVMLQKKRRRDAVRKALAKKA